MSASGSKMRVTCAPEFLDNRKRWRDDETGPGMRPVFSPETRHPILGVFNMKVALSRRKFLKAGMCDLHVEYKILTPVAWDPKTGQARVRIDGKAKVTGAKVFARDIRAQDMPHWPQQQSHAFILRTTRTDRLYAGIDLSLLGEELKPDRVVTADDLARDGVAFPAFYGADMLLPEGKQAAYLGHAVAILIYDDFARYRFAKDKLQFQDSVLRYGEPVPPMAPLSAATARNFSPKRVKMR
eukprot:gene37445-42412_t